MYVRPVTNYPKSPDNGIYKEELHHTEALNYHRNGIVTTSVVLGRIILLSI